MNDLITAVRACSKVGPFLTAQPGIRSDPNPTCDLIERQPLETRERLQQIVDGEARPLLSLEIDAQSSQYLCLWERAAPRGLTYRLFPLPEPQACRRACIAWRPVLVSSICLGLGATGGWFLWTSPTASKSDPRDERLARIESLLLRPVSVAACPDPAASGLSQQDRDVLQHTSDTVASLSTVLRGLPVDHREVEVWLVQTAPRLSKPNPAQLRTKEFSDE